MSNEMLLGLSEDGSLYTIAVNKQNEQPVRIYQQSVKQNNKQMNIKNFAVNALSQTQIIFINDKKQVFFADLKHIKHKQCFVQIDDLSRYTHIPALYFFDENIGYLTQIKGLNPKKQNVVVKKLSYGKPPIAAQDWLSDTVMKEIKRYEAKPKEKNKFKKVMSYYSALFCSNTKK